MRGLNTDKLNTSSLLLRALAHPLRIKILNFIDTYGTINVNMIYKSLGLEQSLTSQHLGILRKSGVVFSERKGKYIHYGINYDIIENTIDTIRSFKL